MTSRRNSGPVENGGGVQWWNRVQTVGVVLMALVMVTSMMAPAAMATAPTAADGASDTAAASVDAPNQPTDIVNPATETPDTNDHEPGGIDGPRSTSEGAIDGERVKLTLITGETLDVVVTDNGTTHIVDTGSDTTLHQVDTEQGTYVYPADVDFSVYDRSLFNIDLLIEEGLTDGEADQIPVILKVSEHRNGQKMGAADAGALSEVSGLENAQTLGLIGANAASLEKDRASVTLERIERNEDLELDGVYLDRTVNVSLDSSVEAIQGEQARQTHDVNGSNVTVAVLDTGVDTEHPDLDDAVVGQVDFTNDGLGDRNGHGTHVAGTIAGDGTASNGTYVGVAPGADIIDVKVLGDDGSGSTSAVVQGIEFSVEQDVDVVSMSLGGPVSENDPLVQAAEAATADGVTVVSAAGNTGPERGTVGSPGVAESAITVGATNPETDQLAGFSSRGPTTMNGYVKPDVVAPGVEIAAARADGTLHPLSTNDQYAALSGTSMAAPHVSGVVALMLEENPTYTPDRAKNVLLSTTDGPVGSEETDVFAQGAGQVNATAAISPSLVVTNATESYGIMEGGETINQTIIVENLGNDSVTIAVTERLVETQSGASHADDLTVNESSVTIPAGESVTLSYTVTADERGVYSGQILLTDTDTNETVRSIFGYTAGTEVAVEKQAYSDTGSVAGDHVWVSARDLGHDRFLTLNESGQATFLATSEEYVVGSSGFDQPTNTAVKLLEQLNTSQQTSITLDERETVAYTVDDSQLDADLWSIQTEAKLQFRPREGATWRTRSRYGTQGVEAVRFSNSSALNASIHHVTVPDAQHDSGDNADVDDIYWLVYGTVGTDSDQRFVVNESDLGTLNRTYHRSGTGEDVQVALLSLTTAWEDRGTSATGFDIGNRTNQRIHVTQNAEYNPLTVFSDGFIRPVYHFRNPPASNTTERTTVNERPLTGALNYVHLGDSYADIAGRFFVTQDTPTQGFEPLDGASRYEVRVNGVTIDQGGNDDSFYSSNDVNLSAGDEVWVGMKAANYGGILSNSTGTTAAVTYDPDGDNTPPRVTDITVVGADEYNSVDAGNVTVRLEVESTDGLDESSLHLLTATEGVAALPWNGSTLNPSNEWDEWDLSVAEQSGTTFVLEGTVNATGYDGRLSIATAVQDVGGDSYRTGSRNAVHVGEPPHIGTDDGGDGGDGGETQSETISGQLLTADGEPAANSSVLINRRDTGTFLYRWLETNATGHFSTSVEAGGVYDLTYMQMTRDQSEGFPDDDNVDIQNLATVNLSDTNGTAAGDGAISTDASTQFVGAYGSAQETATIDTTNPDLGTIQINRGDRLVVEVVDQQGNPVEHATVSHRDGASQEFFGVGYRGDTAADGRPYFGRHTDGGPGAVPGMELNGSTEITVRPPPRAEFVDQEYVRTPTVNNDTTLTVTVEERATVRVGDSENATYTSIQTAVNQVPTETLIVVEEGVYEESVVVNRSVGIISAAAYEAEASTGASTGAAVLDGANDSEVAFTIAPDVEGVAITGFEVRNYSVGVSAQAGNTSRIGVRENTFTDVDAGIVVPTANNTESNQGWFIERNVVEQPSVVGIQVGDTLGVVVAGNVIRGDGDASTTQTAAFDATDDHDSTALGDYERQTSHDGTEVGILVGSTVGANDVAISDNELHGSYNGSGLVVGGMGGNLYNVDVRGNQLANATFGEAGVYVLAENGSYVTEVTVANNTVSGTSTYPAITVEPFDEESTVRNVKVRGNTLVDAWAGVGVGSFNGGWVTGVEVVENDITSTEGGIYVSTANPISGVAIGGNDIQDSESGIVATAAAPASTGTVLPIHLYRNTVSNTTDAIQGAGSGLEIHGAEQSLTNNAVGLNVTKNALVDLVGSEFRDNEIGVVGSDEATVVINDSEIVGNTEYGVLATSTNVTLAATNNWWGANSGPYNPDSNPNGAGDRVSDNVDYEPWIGMDEDGSTTLSIEPNKQQVTAGETVTVNVTAETATNITAIDTVLDINADLFTVEDVSYGPFLSQDGADTTRVGPHVNATTGRIETGESRTTSTGVSGSGTAVTVTLRATENVSQTTETPIRIVDADMLDEANEPVSLTTADANVTLTPAPLDVNATIEEPVHAGQPATMTVTVENATENTSVDIAGVDTYDRVETADGWEYTVTLNESTWNGSETGSYDDTTIEVVATDTDREATTTVETTVREPADISGDGQTALLDLRLLALAYGSETGDANYNPAADLTNDGEVGLDDLTLLSQQWRHAAWDETNDSLQISDARDTIEQIQDSATDATAGV